MFPYQQIPCQTCLDLLSEAWIHSEINDSAKEVSMSTSYNSRAQLWGECSSFKSHMNHHARHKPQSASVTNASELRSLFLRTRLFSFYFLLPTTTSATGMWWLPFSSSLQHIQGWTFVSPLSYLYVVIYLSQPNGLSDLQFAQSAHFSRPSLMNVS